MAAPIDVAIAPFLELSGSYVVRFTALDPNTGDVVPGVVISGATVQYEDAADTTVGAPSPPIPNTAVLLPGPAGA